jgi:hypothetical protein
LEPTSRLASFLGATLLLRCHGVAQPGLLLQHWLMPA